MKKYLLTTGLLTTLFLCACNNEDMLDSPMAEKDIMEKITENDKFVLNITYNGQTYTVNCSNDNDGNLVFLDNDFKYLYENEISHLPNLVTLVKDENSIEYFPSDNEMLKSLDYTLLSEKATKEIINKTRVGFTSIAGRTTLWDDTNYNDRSITFDITYHKFFLWPNLKYYDNFNDKTSALKVWSYIPQNDYVTIDKALIEYKYTAISGIYNPDQSGDTTYSTNDLRVVFLGYHNSNYSGVCFCAVPENDGNPIAYSNLKKYGWNDKISSVILRLAIKGLYTTNN